MLVVFRLSQTYHPIKVFTHLGALDSAGLHLFYLRTMNKLEPSRLDGIIHFSVFGALTYCFCSLTVSAMAKWLKQGLW